MPKDLVAEHFESTVKLIHDNLVAGKLRIAAIAQTYRVPSWAVELVRDYYDEKTVPELAKEIRDRME